MQKQVNKKVLAVLNDLFFTAKINDAAKRAGISVEYVTDGTVAMERAKSDQPMLIVVDLNFDAADPIKLLSKLKSSAATKGISTLGYLSHIQGELKQKAHETGCDMVLPKSAFSLNLSQIFKRHAGTL
jgi:PleD family two-component response regulator